MIGETLGQKYTIVRLIGRGGMGSVYEATHRETLEFVAVKVLNPQTIEAGDAALRRFKREAEAARSIRSDHIVRGLDAGVDEATGNLYLVTELLAGDDLQRVLDRVGPLDPGCALLIASQALAGLRDAHDAGFIHRDIKPANIMLARRPGGAITVKLLDLGLAKIRPEPGNLAEPPDLTTTGSFLGSPLYMSPEQVQSSRDVDRRTDIWSLGCVLYAALTGRAPLQHLSSIGKLLVAICVSSPPLLSDVAPWVKRELVDIVHRALNRDPDARYSSAKAMLEAIRDLVPPGPLVEEMLAPIKERPRALKVVVAPNLGRPLRGDEATEAITGDTSRRDRITDTSKTTADRSPSSDASAPGAARSEVPAIGENVRGPHITVDPRRILGEKTELWTFSVNVHPNVSSLVARIWRSLRRAGAALPPRSYGTSWVLFEPRTGRTLLEAGDGEVERLSLDEAGIRPGAVLWVIPPESEQSTSSESSSSGEMR